MCKKHTHTDERYNFGGRRISDEGGGKWVKKGDRALSVVHRVYNFLVLFFFFRSRIENKSSVKRVVFGISSALFYPFFIFLFSVLFISSHSGFFFFGYFAIGYIYFYLPICFIVYV